MERAFQQKQQIEERINKLQRVMADPIARQFEINKLDDMQTIKQLNQQPTQKIGGQVCFKNDKVVKLLGVCKKRRQSIIETDKNLKKLVERVNLDRPILQKEKIQLILFEKGQEQLESAAQQEKKANSPPKKEKELKVS